MNMWLQALPRWFVPKHCGRTAIKVESSWQRKTTCLHLTSPNWARWQLKPVFMCMFVWSSCLSEEGDFSVSVCRWPVVSFYKGHCLFQALNLDSSSILLRSADFYQQYGIEVWTQKEVVSVNPADKAVKLNDGTLQYYDQLLISTGCRLESSSCSSSVSVNKVYL